MSKAKGARAERKAIALLEAQGYACLKAGGSLGVFDIIAIGPADIRAIQVKAGTSRLSPAERAAIVALPSPSSVKKEYWRFPDRQPVVVEVLG